MSAKSLEARTESETAEELIEGAIGSPEQRRRLLSGVRLKLAFALFVAGVLIAMLGLVFVLVSRIFDQLTPSVLADLEWKARRGAIELAHSADLGMVLGDAKIIEQSLSAYTGDPDVLAIVVTDPTGKILLRRGTAPEPLTQLFSGKPGVERSRPGHVSAWAEAQIEGQPVGRVAVSISTARLAAGTKLKRSILWSAAVGSAIALLAALGFVGLYVGPLLRVTARAFQRLEGATRAALEATRLKSEFLANMSHEIRTPMNGVLGMIELLLTTGLETKQRKYAKTLQSSANTLMTVLDDVLDFSKIEASRLVLHPVPCDPRAVLEQVAELFAPRAHAKRLEITSHATSEVPEGVELDPNRLHQILANLTGNAVKFTESGEVVLRASVVGAAKDWLTLRFAVRDTGIGITEAASSKLFEAFSQVDGSLTRQKGGTGLGLAISKKLVGLMQGRIGVDSSPGEGSTFWFEIPVRVVALDSTSRTHEVLALGYKPRTLIVDDNETNRMVLAELLSSWGVPHRSAASIGAGLEEITRARSAGEPFELVLSDFHLPDGDGADFARAIRADPATRGVSLILLASMAREQLGERGALFDAVLTKPVRRDELSGCLLLLGGQVIPDNARDAGARLRTSSTPPKGPKLLVAEDNAINQLVLVELLEQLGYRTDLVADGRAALEALEHGGYELVLMDCQMPELDGYAATREFRRHEPPGRRLPVIAVTAHAFEGERERALAAGMDDFITKPVSSARLREVLARYIPAVRDEPSLEPNVRRSKRVSELFQEHAPLDLGGIASAVSSKNPSELKQLAHRLRGSCLAIGARRMAELCARLEQLPLDAPLLTAELSAECSRVMVELAAERAKAVQQEAATAGTR